VGLVLATQNPADLDYKGLSNTGTWFIGRLQTERDKARMLDGLEGISSGSKFDRNNIDKTISSLGKRVFLLHNVHEKEPVIFHTRWAMSYLRGPLTRNQIKILMKDKKKIPFSDATQRANAIQSTTRTQMEQKESASRPILPPGIPQFFVYPKNSLQHFQATLIGIATVHYVNPKTKRKIYSEKISLSIYLDEDMLDVDWEEAEETTIEERQLTKTNPGDGIFTSLPNQATKARSYSKWKKEFINYLYRNKELQFFESKNFEMTSKPLESERDFRIRLGDTAREKRDDETEKLRKKYKLKTETLSEKLRKAKQTIEKEKEQSKGRKLQTAISIGASLLSAFSGGVGLNMSTLSRATTAASGVVRQRKEFGDVNRAGETIEAIVDQINSLNEDLQKEIDNLEERFDPLKEDLVEKAMKPRRSDIDIKTVALVWVSE